MGVGGAGVWFVALWLLHLLRLCQHFNDSNSQYSGAADCAHDTCHCLRRLAAAGGGGGGAGPGPNTTPVSPSGVA